MYRLGHWWQYDASALLAGYQRLQTHTQLMSLLLYHGSSGYANAPDCYVTRYISCVVMCDASCEMQQSCAGNQWWSQSYYRQSVTYSEMDAPGLTVLWPNCETRRARAWASCNAKPSSVCHPSLYPSLTHFEVSLPIFLFCSHCVVYLTVLCLPYCYL